ncbi:outer membrane lipoprotein LolB [Pseudorhodoferax sp.]|uniref:outer membrane lipoprotein LolB n=1 Tax=Pseudorhodoferax sp. TaxID=1993553 RepID=UPI0039E28673
MPTPAPDHARRALLLAAALGLAGCAALPPPADYPLLWAGRLALQIASDPPQSFNAAFELRGAPQAGELRLYSPLGSTLAELRWAAGRAELLARGELRLYDSIDALTEDATGTSLPLAALFAWLDGRPADVPGWQADLSRIADGRLSARRDMPLPPAELRVVLQQP